MKTLFFPALIALVLMLSIPSCEKETGPGDISGQLVKNSDCKSFKSAAPQTDAPNNRSCVEYSYDQPGNKLVMKHVNAGFNCCPEKLSCAIRLIGDTISVRESEKSALCDCNCLYDLDIEVSGVSPGKYVIQFIEPYAGDQEKIIFGTDLEKQSSGSFCVTRTKYPWGM